MPHIEGSLQAKRQSRARVLSFPPDFFERVRQTGHRNAQCEGASPVFL